MRFQRIAGLSALGFVTVVVIANIARLAAEAPPAIDAASDKITAYYLDHTTALQLSNALPPLAWLLLAVFAAGAFAHIRPAERDRGEAWSIVGLIGIVSLIVIFAGVVATDIALTAAPTDSMWHLHHAYLNLTSITIAIAITGFSLAGRRTATLKPWHAYVGILAAALLIPAATLVPLTATAAHPALATFGLAGFLLWLLFLAIFGVTLLRTPTPAESVTPAVA